MIEIPEALHIAQQITDHLKGKHIVETWAAVSPHKFVVIN